MKEIQEIRDHLDKLSNNANVNNLNNNPLGSPIPVAITGTTFGNELQTKILSYILVGNLLTFYLCTLATLRWLFQGN